MQKNASSNYHTIQIVFLLIHENAPNIAKILVICNTKADRNTKLNSKTFTSF